VIKIYIANIKHSGTLHRKMDALGALACYDDADEAGGSSSVRRQPPSLPSRTRPCSQIRLPARLLRRREVAGMQALWQCWAVVSLRCWCIRTTSEWVQRGKYGQRG